jgi:hypothetical protein
MTVTFKAAELVGISAASAVCGIVSLTMLLHEVRIVEDGALVGPLQSGSVKRLDAIAISILAPLPIVEICPAKESFDMNTIVVDRLENFSQDGDVEVRLSNVVHMMLERHFSGLVDRQAILPDSNATFSGILVMHVAQCGSYVLRRNLSGIKVSHLSTSKYPVVHLSDPGKAKIWTGIRLTAGLSTWP